MNHAEAQNVAERSMERETSLDAMRVVACVAVVVLHMTAGYVMEFRPTITWIGFDVLSGVTRFCVPLFVMISGALMLGRPVSDYGAYLKRRASAVGKPYIFGAVALTAFDVALKGAPFGAGKFVADLISGNAYYHLYFLFIIFGLYVVSPLLAIANVSTGTLRGATAALFLLVFAGAYLPMLGLSSGMLAVGSGFTAYLPYYLAGYLFYHRISIPPAVGAALFIIGAIITVTGAWFTSSAVHAMNVITFFRYDSTNVAMMTIGIFAVMAGLRNVQVTNRTAEAISGFAALTLGIYVIHPAFITLLGRYVTWRLNTALLLVDIVAATIVLLMSAAFVAVLRRTGLRGYV